MKRIFLLLLFLNIAVILPKAQDKNINGSNWYIKPYANAAIIMQHREILANLIQGYPKIYELNIVKPTNGAKLWHLENNLPEIGLTFSVIDYANPGQLGYGIIAAPFAEIPLNKNISAKRLIMRLCWGPAFVTNPFNIKTNQKNYAIGSHLNAYVQFKWFWKIPINNKIELEPGFMFNHISNGRGQSPNLGLNVLGIGLGINFKAISKQEEKIILRDSSTAAKSKHEWCVWNAYGFNDGEIKGKKQLVSTLSFEYHYNKRNTHKFGGGFDWFYEENYIKDLKTEGIKTNHVIDKTRFGPKICYSYNIGRVSFPIEMGIYLRQLTAPDGLIFHRLGIRYYGKKGLMINFGMRSHWAVAYNFDYGIGYRHYIK